MTNRITVLVLLIAMYAIGYSGGRDQGALRAQQSFETSKASRGCNTSGCRRGDPEGRVTPFEEYGGAH